MSTSFLTHWHDSVREQLLGLPYSLNQGAIAGSSTLTQPRSNCWVSHTQSGSNCWVSHTHSIRKQLLGLSLTQSGSNCWVSHIHSIRERLLGLPHSLNQGATAGSSTLTQSGSNCWVSHTQSGHAATRSFKQSTDEQAALRHWYPHPGWQLSHSRL